VLITTYDSGENWWFELDAPHDVYYAMDVISQKHIWIVGTDGLIIYRSIDYAEQLVENFELKQNYPNPFNLETTIEYQIPAIENVELVIYNMLGQKITTLISEVQSAGPHRVKWDASGYASGIYFYRIKTGDFRDVKKMILIR
jgi:hypothetical protein